MPIGNDIKTAAQALGTGKLVAIPTETVYGLSANALDETAVTKIFAAKQRPSFDPLIVHIAGPDQLEKYAQEVPASAQKLAKTFWPGPLTLVLPKQPIIPDLVTSGLPTVGLRVPNHQLTLQLLRQLDFPLSAPSANPFGYISPTRASHVADQLGEKVAYILDGGPCQVGVESTIVGFPDGQVTIYRKGGLAVEAIEACVGPVQVQEHSSSQPQAPGMLSSHYAPRVPLFIRQKAKKPKQEMDKSIGAIRFQTPLNNIPPQHQVILSTSGDLEEAARNLFAGMRYLDGLPLEKIVAELVPDIGLGRAINDRLRRAAATE